MTESSESTELAAELAMETMEGGHLSTPWHKWVAFTTLVLAVLAAGSALLAGITAHEILIDRTEEIIDVAIAQSDLQRVETLRSKHDIMLQLGLEPDPAEVALADTLEQEANKELEAAAEVRSEAFLVGSAHQVFAIAATLFAVAITVAGLAIILDRRWLWLTGSVVGLGGLAMLGVGIVRFYG